MKKNAQTLHEVAERCTKFCPCEDCGCKNSTNTTNASNTTGTTSTSNSTSKTDSDVTCKNCLHYDASKVCDLNLYEEIVNNHHL